MLGFALLALALEDLGAVAVDLRVGVAQLALFLLAAAGLYLAAWL